MHRYIVLSRPVPGKPVLGPPGLVIPSCRIAGRSGPALECNHVRLPRHQPGFLLTNFDSYRICCQPRPACLKQGLKKGVTAVKVRDLSALDSASTWLDELLQACRKYGPIYNANPKLLLVKRDTSCLKGEPFFRSPSPTSCPFGQGYHQTPIAQAMANKSGI